MIGILGLLLSGGTGNVLGLFGVNYLETVIHLVGGVAGLWIGLKGNGKAFNMWVGWIALVVGILGFIVPGVMNSILGINTAISVLHVVLGVVSLGVAYFIKGKK